MKIMETVYTYKCGCTLKTMYARGATKAEVKREQAWNSAKLCSKCENNERKVD